MGRGSLSKRGFKIARSHIISIGGVRYIRQFWGASATERFANLALDLPKVRYIRQICIAIIIFFVASIGEVCNCRQKQRVAVSRKVSRYGIKIAWSHSSSIGAVRYIRQIWDAHATERFAILAWIGQKCDTFAKFALSLLGFLLLQSVKCVTVVKINGAMGGAKIARSQIDR